MDMFYFSDDPIYSSQLSMDILFSCNLFHCLTQLPVERDGLGHDLEMKFATVD